MPALAPRKEGDKVAQEAGAMMGACCCAQPGGDMIEAPDLPVEPEHNSAKRMTKLDMPMEVKPVVQREGTVEDIKIGVVEVEEGASQGLELLHSHSLNLVVVCGVIKDSPWAKWNDAHPDHMVNPGDEIVEANGQRGDCAAIIAEMKTKAAKKRSMTMVIRRPTQNTVTLDKPIGDTLGLVLVPLDNGNLYIDAVSQGGVVDRWNNDSKAANKVRSLDQIVEVNKTKGNALDLVNALKADGEFQMVVLTHPR